MDAIKQINETSVGELVRAAQQGNRAAFGELFRRYERTVFAIAMRRMGNFAEAEELCQDVFIQAMEKLCQLREADAFAGWLRAITNRMAINRIVRRDPDFAFEPEVLENSCVDDASPLEAVLDHERDVELRAGLDRLGDLDRETLLAFYVRGRSLAEMSDEFEAPLGTIKRRLHVARKRLAREVEPLAV